MMSKLDLVVFGATGFTGKETVVELTKVNKKYGLNWAVAGRSEQKLRSVMQEVSKRTGEDYSCVKLIIADVSDEKSLRDMCSQTSIIVNCCGPYKLYGEPVVKAAVESKTNYVDVTGEPQFIDTIRKKYDKAAREAGIYIVGACGFDSIPNDLGVVFMQQNFDGTLNSVESYMHFSIPPEYGEESKQSGVFNTGTWKSFIEASRSLGELWKLRREQLSELPRTRPKLKTRWLPHKKNGKWCVPFPGVDKFIVHRTQHYRFEHSKEKYIQFEPYLQIGTFFKTLLGILAAGLISFMSMFKCTRNKLLKHPKKYSFGYVSKEGPTEAVMNNIFYNVELYGTGWAKGDDMEQSPSKKIAVRVSGRNPGYGATVSALIYCAIAILTDKDNMPSVGGVFTTGIAFGNTNLVKNLYDNNMKFEVINAGSKSQLIL